MLRHPFNAIITGPTQSGKTHLVKMIIEDADYVISPPIEKVLWYQHENSKRPEIHTHLPIVVKHNLDEIECMPKSLIVIDDLYSEACNSDRVRDIFIRDTHHLDCSIILISQNLFSSRESRHCTTINRNCKYIFLFN